MINLKDMRERYSRAMDFDRENREEAREDLEFRIGGEYQWPEEARRARKDRPMLTINRIPQYVRQVTGDIRINRPAIKVNPVDDQADKEIAKVLTGLIRNIEQKSRAKNAYVTAAEHAVICGLGHFRIIKEYADDDSFDQDLRIQRIDDPFGVVWDPDAKEITKEDAQYCFIPSRLSMEAFKAQYPKASLVGFETENHDYGDWVNIETVRVAEYWFKEKHKKTIVMLSTGEVVHKETIEQLGALDTVQIIQERVVDVEQIKMCIVNGAEVLDGPHDWDGKNIPVIPVVGEEVTMGNKVHRHGIVRNAKDPQRLYNYFRTIGAEMLNDQPKAPYIVAEDQVKDFKDFWANANQGSKPFLPYKPVDNAPPPTRERPPDIPAAMLQESALASDDMKSTVGIYDAALGARSNETSGKAIQARQQESDIGTYVYMDNLSIAISYCGQLLIDLIPRVYDTGRIVRILGEDDTEEFVSVNQTEIDAATGAEIVMNDLSVGKYDVTVTTGPQYSTKRMEAADGMQALIQSNPQMMATIGDLLFKNLDWPGADEIAERMKKTMPPELVGEEGEQAPPPPPNPILELEVAHKQEDLETKRLTNVEKQLNISERDVSLQEVVRQLVMQELHGLIQPQQPAPQEAGFLMPER
ncbi:portal protein [Curvivirga aplysinae]|uniref:portal protein n=1 Tax=Curvivirga aplysinae TaxID=2529852 RepID=UPI0012BC0A38|nr:portal protein [Curvivirga aplysinae]MTI10197.1 hypothetical protein [Curvivirga aplysinae]